MFQIPRQFGVDTGQDFRQQFDDTDFGPERRVQGGEFDANYAAADDNDGLWQFGERQHAGAVYHARQVGAGEVKFDRYRTGGQDYGIGTEGCRFVAMHPHFTGPGEFGHPFMDSDAVCFEQAGHAADQTAYHAVLAVHQGFPVKLY